jgi:predicted fused transcriptional regulator/phosphomethylpyrimidine kinase
LVKDGIPQKDKVKFLGVEYSFTANMISAKTREGSRLQFGDAQYYVIDHYLEEVKRPGPQSRSWYNVHFDPKNLDHFADELDTQDGSKGEERSSKSKLSDKAEAVYEVASELSEGGNDRLEKLVNSGI